MKKSFIMYTDNRTMFDLLSDEEAGQLIKAMFSYADTGDVPKVCHVVEVVFAKMKVQIDANADKYTEICNKRREAVNERWKQKNTSVYKCMQKNTSVYKCIQKNYDTVTDTVLSKDNVNKESVRKKNISFTPTTEQEERFKNFNEWFALNCPNVRKIEKQITADEFHKLLALLPDKEVTKPLQDVLLSIENKKDAIKKYRSVYLTARKWLTNDLQKGGSYGKQC